MPRRSSLAPLLGYSGAVHVALFGAWAAVYTAPPPGGPPSTSVVSAVRMVRKGQPPPPKPKPKKQPEPEPEVPEPTPPPKAEPTKRRPKGPPPPPPPECPGCALLPPGAKMSARAAGPGAIPVGVAGGVPGGVVGGVPGGVVGGKVGGTLGGTLQTDALAKKQVAPEPLEAVMARGIFTPDPDPKLLAKTSTGLLRRGSGVNKTWFCIDERGRTTGVKTTKKFPGDPKIDAICRDAVKRWRFRPLIVGGKAERTCSVARFEIQFD